MERTLDILGKHCNEIFDVFNSRGSVHGCLDHCCYQKHKFYVSDQC